MLNLMQYKVDKYFVGRKLMISYSPFVEHTGNSRVGSRSPTSVGKNISNVDLILEMNDNLSSVSLEFWQQVPSKMLAEQGNGGFLRGNLPSFC